MPIHSTKRVCDGFACTHGFYTLLPHVLAGADLVSAHNNNKALLPCESRTCYVAIIVGRMCERRLLRARKLVLLLVNQSISIDKSLDVQYFLQAMPARTHRGAHACITPVEYVQNALSSKRVRSQVNARRLRLRVMRLIKPITQNCAATNQTDAGLFVSEALTQRACSPWSVRNVGGLRDCDCRWEAIEKDYTLLHTSVRSIMNEWFSTHCYTRIET